MTSQTKSVREIYDEEGGDLAKIATRLGISMTSVMQKVGSDTKLSLPVKQTPPDDLLNWRPNWRPHLVAIRHNDAINWAPEDKVAIQKSRDRYEAGTHELCQRRQGEWTILYAIPRRKGAGSRRFFSHMEDMR